MRNRFGRSARVHRCALVISWCAALLFCMCAPQPTQVGAGNYPIQLTLEDGTKTQATFSGEPIIAYITLPDSTAFDPSDGTWEPGITGTPTFLRP